MLYFLIIWEMLLSFLKRNSKIVTFIILISLFSIAAFSYGTADFEIYEGRYNYYDVKFIISQTEPLYTLLIKLARRINLPYRVFLAIEYFVIIGSFSYFVKKFTKNANFILFLYIIWPFCRDVVVLRTTLGSAFVYIGLNFLLKGGKRNVLIYSFFVLVGGLIHYSMLFFELLVIIDILKNKEVNKQKSLLLVFGALFCAELFIFKVFPNLPFTGTLMNKINFVLQRGIENKNILKAPGAMRTVLMFIIYYFLHKKVICKLIRQNDNAKIEISEKVFYINLYVLLIIPLLNYFPDLVRLQQCIALLSYVEFSFYFSKQIRMNTIKKSEIIFWGQCMVYALLYLFIIVINTDQIDTVFRSLFEKNLLNTFLN